MTIIVLLILAGVSLNAIIGDNGIITNAIDSSYLTSCATLEEFFGEYYVENYENFDNTISKIEYIRNKNSDWFYDTPDGYVVDDAGHALYLIVKANLLKDNPNLEIKGGNAGSGTYEDYRSLNDVYGVTKDLKVYYCSNGISTLLGINEGDLDLEDFSRVVVGESSELANLIPHEEGKGLTVQDLRNVDTLTIESDSGLKDFSELYRLSSLKSLTIKGKKNNQISLSGLQRMYNLNYLCFYNCDLDDYSSLSGLSSLQYLYLYNSCDDEVDKVFNSMSKHDYTKLNYIGVFGVIPDINTTLWWSNTGVNSFSSVSNINSLENLTTSTKQSVKYILLNNNKLTNVSVLSKFTNIEYLIVSRNDLNNLNGLESLENIKILSASFNENLSDISSMKNASITSISLSWTNIVNLDDLKISREETMWFDFRNCKNLENISPIKYCSKCEMLYLEGCTNLMRNSVKEIRYIWEKVPSARRSIESMYLDCLETEERKDLTNKVNNDKELYDKIFKMTDVTKLNLFSNIGLANTSFSTLDNEIQNDIKSKLGDDEKSITNDAYFRYILSSLTNMQYLDLEGITNLTNIDFVKYMPNLIELNLRGTNVTDLSILDELKSGETDKLSNLGILVIDNVNTDFTKFQKTIEGLFVDGKPLSGKNYWYSYGAANYFGLYLGNESCISKEITGLKNCSQIKKLSLKLCMKKEDYAVNIIDLSNMTGLEKFYGFTTYFPYKLPSSVNYVYGVHIDFPFFNASEKSSSQLTYYEMHDCNETTQASLQQMFNSLEYCQTDDKISFRIYNVYNVENLNGIENLKNLNIESFSLIPYYGRINDLSGLGELNNGTGYITKFSVEGNISSGSNVGNYYKLPNISNCNIGTLSLTKLGLVDIGGLAGNTHITSLDLSNNFIGNLKSLSSMSNLASLTMSNNNIYNKYLDGDTEINNLDILYNLNHSINASNSLTYVNLQNNKFDTKKEEYIKVKNSFSGNCLW